MYQLEISPFATETAVNSSCLNSRSSDLFLFESAEYLQQKGLLTETIYSRVHAAISKFVQYCPALQCLIPALEGDAAVPKHLYSQANTKYLEALSLSDGKVPWIDARCRLKIGGSNDVRKAEAMLARMGVKSQTPQPESVPNSQRDL